MAASPDPDTELMRRVKRGDREAFARLVDRYKQPVMNLVYRMVHDLAEAEDLTQSAFLQVYKAADRYREASKFSTWLYTIARNLCLNELRRRSRHPAETLEATRPGEDSPPEGHFRDPRAPNPPDQVLRIELEQKVQEAIDSLPSNQRLALLLCRQDELSYEEMAQVLGCSLSATKSLIHRGRETLRSKLKPYLQTGFWEPEEK